MGCVIVGPGWSELTGATVVGVVANTDTHAPIRAAVETFRQYFRNNLAAIEADDRLARPTEQEMAAALLCREVAERFARTGKVLDSDTNLQPASIVDRYLGVPYSMLGIHSRHLVDLFRRCHDAARSRPIPLQEAKDIIDGKYPEPRPVRRYEGDGHAWSDERSWWALHRSRSR